MKKPFALLLLASMVAALLAGCSNITPAFAGLSATLAQLERDGSGRVQATVKFNNPNLAAYNVGKSVHRVYLDGTEVGTVNLDRPFGIPPQNAVAQDGELKLEGAGAAALQAAAARGSAAYRLETTTTFQLFGENKEVIKTSASGTVPVLAK